MKITEALIISIENYDWHDIVRRRYDEYDYDLWKDVANNLLGSYKGNDNFDAVLDYYEESQKKVTTKLIALGDNEPDEELNQLVAEARLAYVLKSALDPERGTRYSVKEPDEPYSPTPEQVYEAKAKKLINGSSSIEYCSKGFLNNFTNAISGLVNEKIKGHTFSTYLFKLISEHGYEETSVYKVAGLNRQQFSKIRKRDYQPTKPTVFALILAMQLNIDDALELMRYAGYTFSPSSKLDRTIEFFVRQGIYDIELVNYILYKNDILVLGSKSRD